MNLLVLSDLHLGPQTQQRNQQFLDFLQAAHENKDEVLIAGDLFELWFGWADLTFEYQQPIIEKMRELAHTGLVMDYVEGNHDFGIERYRRQLFREVFRGALDRVWFGRKVHVEHGDLINPNDFLYRSWRWISKNPISFFLIDHLPRSFLLRLATRLEKGMKHTNLKYKMNYPEEASTKFYRRQFEKGADIVVVGHFHEQREVPVQLQNRNVLFYNLPGWEQGFRYLVIPQGERPHFTEWGMTNGNSSTT
jgi:UDP-2,3-diacylglucosamine hydrolase